MTKRKSGDVGECTSWTKCSRTNSAMLRLVVLVLLLLLLSPSNLPPNRLPFCDAYPYPSLFSSRNFVRISPKNVNMSGLNSVPQGPSVPICHPPTRVLLFFKDSLFLFNCPLSLFFFPQTNIQIRVLTNEFLEPSWDVHPRPRPADRARPSADQESPSPVEEHQRQFRREIG